MEDNLFQQAKKAISNLTNMQNQGNVTENDNQIAQKAIQAAYENATPEEEQQLQQLEQQLKQSNQIK